MTIEQIRSVRDAKPFNPFILHIADGRQLRISSPESIMNTPSGRTVYVFNPDDTVNIVELLLVTDIELLNGHRLPSAPGR